MIIDSGFFVLKLFIGMFGRGIYSSALVKKCRYWPTVIYGDEINANCEKK